jgi:hypothetical protein
MTKTAPVVLLLLAATFTACKKKATCTAGHGGNLELVLFPQHHAKPIFSQDAYRDTAYIKFNTQDAPGTSDYDLVIAGEAGEEHIHIPGMKCGSYYIYCTGYDTSIHQRVKGGIPYNTSQTSGEIDINVPVSE